MKKTDLLQNVFTGVLVFCALLVTGLLVRRELMSPSAEAVERSLAGTVADWRVYADEGTHRVGPDAAPVTVVEFSDFQCPFCRVIAARLDSLRALHPREVAVVYRHYPLRIHPHAVAAARASECAAEQGRFWEMHDAIYREQESIGQLRWGRFAELAGIADSGAFERCMDRVKAHPAIRDDTLAGGRLRVAATPTLLINQYRLTGAPPLDTLRAYVQRFAQRGTRTRAE
ncbi:MAG TPA: DsbA family protein [Longimicrobium sp.]|jgi:protein-disulfide isomerase